MRNEFPNPMERRERWQPLNGKWLFSFDKPIYDREIEVPFAYQTEASGVNEKEHHETVWYKRDVILNDEMKSSERVVVRFLAVDYEATVFVNGRFACFHAGGYEAFSVDITDLITREKETIEVKVADPLDADRPRGKQDWNENPSRCWYYQTTGIWQSVWLEGYGSDYIRSFGITPDAEKTDVRFDVSLASGEAETIVVDIESQFFDGPLTFTASVARKRKVVLVANLPKPDLVYDKHLWSPAAPNLYRATIKTITCGRISDEVKTHFAFRTVEARNGKILLNGVPFEPKMVLDQGYWRSGGMTAPSARSFEEDILAAKARRSVLLLLCRRSRLPRVGGNSERKSLQSPVGYRLRSVQRKLGDTRGCEKQTRTIVRACGYGTDSRAGRRKDRYRERRMGNARLFGHNNSARLFVVW